jgi:hypothetical protein
LSYAQPRRNLPYLLPTDLGAAQKVKAFPEIHGSLLNQMKVKNRAVFINAYP